jgi:spore germination protein YaaH
MKLQKKVTFKHIVYNISISHWLAIIQYTVAIIQYTVQPGDNVSSIAEKFGVSVDTIRWQNNLASRNSIKVGQTLEILPVPGVSHKVTKGDTVYSIAKKYDSSPQAIVDYVLRIKIPYNVNFAAQIAVRESLQDTGYLLETVAKLVKERKRLLANSKKSAG